MKKILIILAILTFLCLGAIYTHLPEQLLALLLVGLIPYTQISVPPLAMFFVWALLPVLLFFFAQTIRGLYILTLLAIEQIEYAIYARMGSKKKTTRAKSRRKTPVKQSVLTMCKQNLQQILHRAQNKTTTYIKPEQPEVKVTKLNNIS